MRLKLHTLLLAILASLLFAKAVPNLRAQTLKIDEFTADCIDGFTHFVKWENEPHIETIKIAVINSPEVAHYLERRARTRVGHPQIEIVEPTLDESFEDFHFVFIGPGHRRSWVEIHKRCHEHGVLSIGFQDGFIAAGGCVQFAIRKNRLKFYVSHENAKNAGIIVSSKLLEIALEPKE